MSSNVTGAGATRIPTYYSEQKVLIFEWTAGEEKGFNHYLCGYPPISLEMYRKVLDRYGLAHCNS